MEQEGKADGLQRIEGGRNEAAEKKRGFSIQRLMEQRRGSCPSALDEGNQSDPEPSSSASANRPAVNRYMFTHRPRIVIDLEHNNRSLADATSMFTQANIRSALCRRLGFIFVFFIS